jgi:ribulose-phosphate 3-epimerase
MNIKIYPSILAADFSHLADEVKRVEDSGADGIHIDIMDGHFVPNFSMGPSIVAAINRTTSLFLEVHLMIYNPYEYIERFIEMGADMITFHFEASEDVEETLAYIRRCGKKAGLAFNPETSISMSLKYLNKCDGFLFMSVHPGFGGQKFIPKVLDKIEFTRETCNKLNIGQGGQVQDKQNKKNLLPFDIQVDGGINLETGKTCIEKGANILSSGSYLFSQKNMKKAVDALRACK